MKEIRNIQEKSFLLINPSTSLVQNPAENSSLDEEASFNSTPHLALGWFGVCACACVRTRACVHMHTCGYVFSVSQSRPRPTERHFSCITPSTTWHRAGLTRQKKGYGAKIHPQPLGSPQKCPLLWVQTSNQSLGLQQKAKDKVNILRNMDWCELRFGAKLESRG